LESAQIGAGPARLPRRGHAPQDEIFQAVRAAELALLRLVAVLVHRVDLRADDSNLWLRIHPSRSRGDERAKDVPDAARHVATVVLGKPGMAFALEKPHVRVVADDDVQLAVAGYFLEESDVAGMQPVEASGDHHAPARG